MPLPDRCQKIGRCQRYGAHTVAVRLQSLVSPDARATRPRARQTHFWHTSTAGTVSRPCGGSWWFVAWQYRQGRHRASDTTGSERGPDQPQRLRDPFRALSWRQIEIDASLAVVAASRRVSTASNPAPFAEPGFCSVRLIRRRVREQIPNLGTVPTRN
jgi:hypothetical protein